MQWSPNGLTDLLTGLCVLDRLLVKVEVALVVLNEELTAAVTEQLMEADLYLKGWGLQPPVQLLERGRGGWG